MASEQLDDEDGRAAAAVAGNWPVNLQTQQKRVTGKPTRNWLRRRSQLAERNVEAKSARTRK